MKKLNYGDVMNHAIKVTNETVADVIFEYAGHVDSVSLHIYKTGYGADEKAIFFPGHIACIVTNEEEIHDQCEEMIAFINANVGGE